MTRAFFLAVTAPFWVPALMVASAASLAIGMTMTVMSIALKDRPAADVWRYDDPA